MDEEVRSVERVAEMVLVGKKEGASLHSLPFENFS